MIRGLVLAALLLLPLTAEAFQATGTWVAPVDPNRRNVRVERQVGTGAFAQLGPLLPATATTFNDPTVLADGTQYCFRAIPVGDVDGPVLGPLCGPKVPAGLSNFLMIFGP